jgi:hypothetical protein
LPVCELFGTDVAVRQRYHAFTIARQGGPPEVSSHIDAKGSLTYTATDKYWCTRGDGMPNTIDMTLPPRLSYRQPQQQTAHPDTWKSWELLLSCRCLHCNFLFAAGRSADHNDELHELALFGFILGRCGA